MTSPNSPTPKMGRASVTHVRRPPWLKWLAQLFLILDVGALLSGDA